MTNFTCHIGSGPDFGFCPAAVPSYAPAPVIDSSDAARDSVSLTQVVGGVGLIAIAGLGVRHLYNIEVEAERERQAQARTALAGVARHIINGAVHDAVREGLPIAAEVAGRALHLAADRASRGWDALSNWWNRPAAGLLQANPASAALVDESASQVDPTVVSEAELAAQAAVAEESFRDAATTFVRDSFNFRTMTPQIYSAFITAQTNANFQVPIERMHVIFSEIFANIRNWQVPGFIAAMRDHETLDAEIAATAALAAARREGLLAQDAMLAGAGRFDGLVDAAWADYFNAAKQQTEALAKLCHFMAGHGAKLTDHEIHMLSQLHPKHQSGAVELNAMQQGVKRMVSGNALIMNAELLTRAAKMVGAEGLIRSFQEASTAVTTTFATYSARNGDRDEIAGEGVNPHTEAAAEGSAIARTAAEVARVEAGRVLLIAQREAQIALIERFAAGTQGGIYVAPADGIGGV